jgi:DNA-binding CsgD family transcriptional regulator
MDAMPVERPQDSAELVGREAALEVVRRVLTAGAMPAALVIEGEAGIGKTSVWRAAVELGEPQFDVFTARPGESEAALPYVVLGDLLRDVAESDMASLAGPQRAAVEIALFRRAAAAFGPPRRAVALGLLALIRQRASLRPVLLALDDLQWVDEESMDALRFVLRRLENEPVLLLGTERIEPGAPPRPLEVAGRPTERLALDGLVAGALRHLLGRRFGRQLDRPTFTRVNDATRGNPLFAIEMTRALLARPTAPRPEEPLPVPRDLGVLLRQHVAEAPDQVRDILDALAVMLRPTSDLVHGLLGDDGLHALRAATDLGLVEATPDRIRFTHPLLGTVIDGELEPRTRRDLHRRLANVETQPEARARHLALAADGPDGPLARELERTATETEARLAPAAAGELMELALALTPPTLAEERARRARLAGHYLFAAGETERGRRLTEAALETAPPGRERVEALWRLGVIRSYQERTDLTATQEMLDEAAGDTEMLMRLHDWLSRHDSDTKVAYEHALEASRLAAERDDEDALVPALTTTVSNGLLMGAGIDEERFARVLELQEVVVRRNRYMRAITYPSVIFAWALAMTAEPAPARALLRRAWEITEDLGDDSTEPYLHVTEARVAFSDGRLADAVRSAEACRRTAEDLGHDAVAVIAVPVGSIALAMQGRLAEAAASASKAIEDARSFGHRLALADALFAGAAIELWSGHPASSLGLFREGLDVHEERGLGDPGLFQFRGNLVEALLANGLVDEAGEAAAWLERRGRELCRSWAVVVGLRSRGLVRAAGGELEPAVETLARAVEEARPIGMPIDLGRSLLAHGRTLRRLKRKRPAREALDEAAALFASCGADLWREAVRFELARIGGRAPSGFDLTPTERQVADLAASGRSNKDIAAELFMSPNTVKSNLARVYRKTGASSRAELANLLASARA